MTYPPPEQTPHFDASAQPRPQQQSGPQPIISGGAGYPSAGPTGPSAPSGFGAQSGGFSAPHEGGAPSSDDRSLAVIAHLSTLVATLLSAGWLTFVGPLVLWLIYKDKSPFVRQAAAGAFNFSLACWIGGVVAWIAFITIIGIPVAILLGLALLVVTFLFPILGAVSANRGERYGYPFQIPVLS